MPQQFDPAFEPFDPAFEPVTTGQWVKRGLTTMWVPDTPVDLENRPDQKWIEPKPALDLVERAGKNMRESSLGRTFPTLANIASSMMEGTNKMVIEAVSEPDILMTGLSGLLRPKVNIPEVLPPKSPAIKGLLPEHSATAPPTFYAGPTGKVIPATGASEESFAELMNPLIRGARGRFTNPRPVSSSTGQPIFGSPDNLPSAPTRFKIQPGGKFVDEKGIPIVPPDEFLKTTPTPKRDWMREAYELARGTTAAWDISAPFRQGIGMVGTRNWFKAWLPMFRAFGSEKSYQAVLERIKQLPHVSSGLSTQARLPLTDITQFGSKLGPREEILSSKLAEKIPGIRASNRAYTAYLNHLRANTFNDWVDDAIAQGLDPNTNIPLAQNIADVVGDLTGRGSLRLDVGLPSSKIGNVRLGRTINLERHTARLADIFFAPRLMASRIRMLNPSTYIMLDPFARRKELEGLLRLGAWWMSAAGLMRAAGADVSTDPTSADFGKVRLDDKTRVDVAGGYQQYLVLATKLLTGKYTSTVTGQTKEFGSEYGAETRFSTTQRFFVNKLHPTLKFVVDLASATQNRPVQLGDRIIQMYAPMLLQDIFKIANDKPELLPWLAPAAATGMSTQMYDKGPSEPLFIPKENDIMFGGGKFLPD